MNAAEAINCFLGNRQMHIALKIVDNTEEPRNGMKIMNINKHDLCIDYTYQRSNVSKSIVNKIAKNFNWAIFSPLIVVLRDDAKYYIADGQHRWLASLLRDDIVTLPCCVSRSLGVMEEAKIFSDANLIKNPMSALDKHRARLVGGDPVAMACEIIASQFKYRIQKGDSTGCFQAIGIMAKCAKDDPKITEEAFGICARISENYGFCGTLLRGVFTLIKTMKCNKRFVNSNWSDRLVAAGIERCMKEIRNLKVLSSTQSEAVEAAALLKIINHGRHIRFSI